MFKKENRLIPGVKFNRSYTEFNLQFTLKEKKNGLSVNRFGIIVSKKIDKRATERNKIKRYFRTKLTNLYGKMNAGHDILFIIKKGVIGKTKEEKSFIIEKSLEEAGIINK